MGREGSSVALQDVHNHSPHLMRLPSQHDSGDVAVTGEEQSRSHADHSVSAGKTQKHHFTSSHNPLAKSINIAHQAAEVQDM